MILKFKKTKKVEQNLLKIFDTESADLFFDKTKLIDTSQEFQHYLRNYLLFQIHHHFRWPLWISYSLDEFNKDFSPIYPPLLRNIQQTDYIEFSTFLSKINLAIDPSGMISPINSIWSIEIWFLYNDVLFRPQDMMDKVSQKWHEEKNIISTTIKDDRFSFFSELYGTRTNIDEAIVHINCQPTSSISHLFLIVAIRPYTLNSIGGIKSIEYETSNKIIHINGFSAIAVDTPPKDIFVGNSKYGDIDFNNRDIKVECPLGMATIALMYQVKKTGFHSFLRINISNESSLKPLNLNYENIQKDFCEYIKKLSEKGIQISIPDKSFSRWFIITKIKTLGIINKTIFELVNAKNSNCPICQKTYFVLLALVRMGYHEEVHATIIAWLSIGISNKDITFNNVICYSYLVASFTDYFIISRNIEFLTKNIENLRKVVYAILNFIKINKVFNIAKNSITNKFTAVSHHFDLILITNALLQYAYLCRTLGLFGEENTFQKEAEKMQGTLVSHFEKLCSKQTNQKSDEFYAFDEYGAYLLMCYYPFHISKIQQSTLLQYVQLLEKFYKKFPIFIRSTGGWDVFLSMMYANNLLLLGNKISMDIFNIFTSVAGTRYSLPEIMNPHNLKGISQIGDSHLANASIFLFMRNSLFYDKPERLELFPIPLVEWFKPKVEIEVKNAPSRFGEINFKVVNTENEVQIYFTELPKYIPPEILINLPFPAVIKSADDFVIKKDFGESFIINGWPSVLQFLRKER